jgi:hypothetical protein
MYSAQSLQALEDQLSLHQGLVWVDPSTNQIAVKRITQVQESDPPESFHSVDA